jgi:hypothetical protein
MYNMGDLFIGAGESGRIIEVLSAISLEEGWPMPVAALHAARDVRLRHDQERSSLAGHEARL